MKRFFYLLFVLLFAVSCTKDEFNFNKLKQSEISPALAVPIAHSSMALKDIVLSDEAKTFIKEDADGFISLVYRQSLFSKSAGEIITLPAQVPVTESFSLSIPTPLPPSFTIIKTHFQTVSFATNNGEKLDSMTLKSAKLTIDLVSTLDYDAKVVVSSSQIIKNGATLNDTVEYSGTSKTFTSVVDMSGYTIDFSDDGTNSVEMAYTILAKNVPFKTPSNPYNVNIDVRVDDLTFKSIYGYLGVQTFNVAFDTLSIDLFKNQVSGQYEIADPSVSFHLDNSIGIPSVINTSVLKASNGTNSLAFAGSAFATPWKIGAPTSPGGIVPSTFELNTANSNIKNIMAISPKNLEYNITATLNPDGFLVQNFALDTSKINVDVEVEIPLHGYAGDFVLQDTIETDLSDILGDLNMIEYVNFLILIKNTFPVNALAQVYFADSNYVKLDSLFSSEEALILASPPDPLKNFKSVTVTEKFTKVEFSSAKMKKIANAKYLLINGRINSYDNMNKTNIKIYSDYMLDVKLGIQAKAKLSIGLNSKEQ